MFEWLPFYPIRVWGIILIVLSLLLWVALQCQERDLAVALLQVLAGYWLFWAVLIAAGSCQGQGLMLPWLVPLWAFRHYWVATLTNRVRQG